MQWILQISTLLLVIHHASAYNSEVSFRSGENTYSTEDETTLRCFTVSSGMFFSPSAQQKWYKRQQDSWTLVGIKDSVEHPFPGDRLSIDFIYDDDTPKEAILDLTIKNVGLADSGDYKCVVVYKEETFESDAITLYVQPADGVNTADITTEIEEMEGKYKFNVEAQVSCSGSTQTHIAEVDLSMMLDNEDVTNNFLPLERRLEWEGDVEGLKTPVTYLELASDNYQPDKTGESVLSCKLSYGADADKTGLAITNIVIVRDETAYLKCWDNLDGKANIGQLDVSLTCAVMDYSGNRENLVMKWEFLDKNCTEGTEVAIYSTDQLKYHRRADMVGDNFRLTINKVRLSMADCGSVAIYKATLLPDQFSVDNPIASHTASIMIDTSQKYLGDNGAGVITVAFTTLISSLLLQPLL